MQTDYVSDLRACTGDQLVQGCGINLCMRLDIVAERDWDKNRKTLSQGRTLSLI